MQKLTKPNNFNTLWSQNGSRSDISGKQATGWLVEIPQREVMNSLQYRQDYGIAYLLQSGVSEYDNGSTYFRGNITNIEGVLYRCLEQIQGVHPVTGSNASRYWVKTSPTWSEFQVILNRVNSADPFPQYISVSDPRTPEVIATSGIKSHLDDTKNLKFVGGTLQYSFNNQVLYTYSNSQIPVEDSSKNVATTEWVQALVASIRAGFEVSIGESIITTRPENPATYKGYGTWVLDCQGQAIVGVSTNSGASEWLKVVDNVYGEEKVTLTEQSIPSHHHYTDSRFNKLTAIAEDVFADTSVRQTTAVSYDYISRDVELGVGTITPLAKTLMTMKSTGGGQPHNNVQPSKTKYVYTRIG